MKSEGSDSKQRLIVNGRVILINMASRYVTVMQFRITLPFAAGVCRTWMGIPEMEETAFAWLNAIRLNLRNTNEWNRSLIFNQVRDSFKCTLPDNLSVHKCLICTDQRSGMVQWLSDWDFMHEARVWNAERRKNFFLPRNLDPTWSL